ncbi:MAG TPA: hypothetical protein IAD37_11105 [Candidatus Limiplasma merdipullorum]|nr:hypothetical protein [Candidatus Limiplasma merdipullorum]
MRRTRVRCGRVWMRARGVPVREGGVRLPRDCAAREGKIARRTRVP